MTQELRIKSASLPRIEPLGTTKQTIEVEKDKTGWLRFSISVLLEASMQAEWDPKYKAVNN